MKSRARGATLGIVALCVVSSLGWTTRAQAYCRSMTCELGNKTDVDPPCPRDENQCVTQGQPLHWGSPCLTYTVQVDGSPKSKLDADQIQAFVAQAFDAWKSARCPGGGSPRFEAAFEGFVSCDRHERICESADKNVNAVMFHDSSWPYAASKIAVTTPTAGKESGLVVDTDVEINAQNFTFTSGPAGAMPTSLRFVLTHELGHFLGLAHSLSPSSVMSPGYQSLPLSSTLISPDDAAAICAVFPPGPKLSCGAPPAPAYDMCQIPIGEEPPCKLGSITQDSASCGCRLAASSPARSSTLAAFGLLTIALGARRTRRKRRSPR